MKNENIEGTKIVISDISVICDPNGFTDLYLNLCRWHSSRH
ncbi:hypothetical protein [Siminovitchia fortis]|nr:hypothetical protein [Siminovitchia fortis]